jgi:predicted phage tail protein
MSDHSVQRIIGAGGDPSGGGSGISESPDSLSSNAFVQFIDVIGEGEIKGLVNGESSIYLNGVPMRDLSGTPNYQAFTWSSTNGSASATHVIPKH